MAACLCLLLTLTACGGKTEAPKTYGVFLSVTENTERLRGYQTVVIDAQYFTEDEITELKSGGTAVYSYLNVGSLETFRPYYDEFKALALSAYENWDEEYWVDVTDERWQRFVTDTLAPALTAKGADGFFVDNCDVYYHYPTPETLQGLATMLRALVKTGKAVLINGGDTFLDAYCENGGRWQDVMTGINQETVFSRILWDGDRFGTATKEDEAYFKDYIERYAAEGADIYLLEYTHSRRLAEKIYAYCSEMGFACYISDSVELD